VVAISRRCEGRRGREKSYSFNRDLSKKGFTLFHLLVDVEKRGKGATFIVEKVSPFHYYPRKEKGE